MARKHRRRDGGPAELRSTGSIRRVEEHPDGDWVVQRTTGSAATKPYRCPGCDQLIPPATPHTVAWPADDPSGMEHRRHWHNPCWANRAHRRPSR